MGKNAVYLWVVLICVGAFLPESAHARRGLEVFSGREVESTNLKPFPKWTGMLDRYFDHEKLRQQPCDSHKFNSCKLRQWNRKLSSLHDKPLTEQLNEVNRYLNQVRYVLDPINWQVADYWTTPHEFFAVDGDCEDYAIAKFLSLRALGVPNEDMRIMVVQDMNLGGITHSILAVRADDDIYILDNQIAQVVTAGSIYHYRPIYSINEAGWWRH